MDMVAIWGTEGKTMEDKILMMNSRNWIIYCLTYLELISQSMHHLKATKGLKWARAVTTN